jgi:hypothetical protein
LYEALVEASIAHEFVRFDERQSGLRAGGP